MEEHQDIVMGEDQQQKLPSLPSHLSLEQPVMSPTPHQKADPILAPSLIPIQSQSPSFVSDNLPTRDHLVPEDTASKYQVKSDSDRTSASNNPEASHRKDDLAESSGRSDHEAFANPSLAVKADSGTGLCYDGEMRYHCEVRPSSDNHPEDPRRIVFIYRQLCEAGLFYDKEFPAKVLQSKLLKWIPARRALKEELTLVHTNEHYDFIQSTSRMSDEKLLELETVQMRDSSIYFNNLSYEASLLSAGGAIETCLAVAKGTVNNAIAVIRPPGHHAETDAAMGFCLFNNVSIAARVCQKELGDACRKILIVDWDVHHGNGIQKAFYDDPNVLYISIHVYQNGRFYPCSEEGDWHHIGEGYGRGRNVNIPWPDQGMGDAEYMHAFEHVVMPIAHEFNPDLVIVASGFDAAAGDELGGCMVTPECYGHMTHLLKSLAGGKVAVCLEGGYNLDSISKSSLAVTRVLMGSSPDRMARSDVCPAGISTVNRVRGIQAPYWNSLRSSGVPQLEVSPDGGRLRTGPMTFDGATDFANVEDVIRDAQSKTLYDNSKLTPLYIYRTNLSQSFKNQVLASPNYFTSAPLIVIFHDPPEVVGVADPVTNRLEAHNCWVAASQMAYIQWMIGKGYSVIDVNVPKNVMKEGSSGDEGEEQKEQNRPQTTEEIAGYLWDNYIEPSAAKTIFFLGIGSAFSGIANLLIQRENLYTRVTGCISFVAENPVRAIAAPTQTWLSGWYRANSLVFVSHQHGIWERKPSKRYGQLRQSPKASLSDMLTEHKEEVFEWLAERADGMSDNSSGSDDDESR